MSWHADRESLAAYVRGSLGRTQASSVDTHLVACAQCRAALSPMVDADRIDRNLAAIGALVDRPDRRWPERALARCGVSDRLVRVAAVAPGARDPWLGAIAVVLAMATGLATFGGGARNAYLFLVAAPLLPVVAVAAVFASRDDPARELIAATSSAGLELLMARWAAVVVPAFAVTGVLAIAVPGVGWTAMAWLLPSVCMAVATMALASWFPVRAVAIVVGGVWVAAAAASARGAARGVLIDRFVAFRPAGQVGWVVATAAGAVVLLLRREAFDLGRDMGGIT